jgi:cytochrome c-type biogenesis protein CcmH
MKRRDFIVAACGAIATLPISRLAAQQSGTRTMAGPMEGDRYRPVSLPPKAGAKPLLDDEQIKDMEGGLRCQCSCRLDIFTCRTTDFTCPLSPAMHKDVVRLVDGGYSADEIVDAFASTYGEVVRMAPKATGFNTIGYIAPFAVMGAAGAAAAVWIARSLKRQRMQSVPLAPVIPINGTPEELERIQRALRDEPR